MPVDSLQGVTDPEDLGEPRFVAAAGFVIEALVAPARSVIPA